MAHLHKVYKAQQWQVSYSRFTATKAFMPHIIAVVSLKRDSTNKIFWIVRDIANKKTRCGRADSIEKAKALAGAWGYALAKKLADNTILDN